MTKSPNTITAGKINADMESKICIEYVCIEWKVINVLRYWLFFYCSARKNKHKLLARFS
jgi:hypothetical protein